jgi:hypothetical protein
LPQGPRSRKRAAGAPLQPGQLWADPVPDFRAQRRDRPDHDPEFDRFANLAEFNEVDAP